AVALRQSKKAGFKNTPALVGVIVGALGTVAAIVGAIVLAVVLSRVAETCAELGPGRHQVGSGTITCPG
ncbi:MAG: hypothetical protein ACLGIF_11515, partial [Actinomycetes bacterium]